MTKIYFTSLLLIFFTIQFSSIDAKLGIAEMKNMAKPWGKSCSKKTDLPPELQEAHSRGEFPEDERLMCYLYCCAKMGKIMDKSGKIDLSNIKQQLDIIADEQYVNRMFNVFETCEAKMTATEPCRLAYEYSICYYEMDKEVYMFP